MPNYIAIDGGTTNTRINLVCNNIIIDTLKYNIGAGKNIENKNILKETLKNGIAQILNKNNMQSSDILRILASGMLTSEYGIHLLEHIEAPAGIEEFHKGMEETLLSEISDIPFVFIRGVKLICENIGCIDIMRGEETELIGLSDNTDAEKIYVLPGSHSKIIKTDNNGKITDFSTTLTGEMIAALSHNTILKDAVDFENAGLNNEYLQKGFECCRDCGINKAIFKTRILKNMFSKSVDEIYSYFIGVVLCGEISEIMKQTPKCVVIGGKRQIKNAMYALLKHNSDAEIVCVSDDAAEKAAVLGMIKIFEYKEQKQNG